MKKVESTRSAERKPLEMLVKGRSRSRPIFVEILDVSEGGCKVKGSPGFAEVGENILLRIDGVHTPVGRFVWVDGKHAGVAFEGKMHPAIVDHLHKERLRRLEEREKGRKLAQQYKNVSY